MLKKSLSFAFIILLLNAFSFNFAFAGSKENKEARFAARVKENVRKLGTGKDARVEVKLRDKTKLKGYVSQINENSFIVVEDNTNLATEVPYPNAKQVTGQNLPAGVKIAIIAGIALAVIILVVYAAGK